MSFDRERFHDLYPFESRWLLRGNNRLHYVDEGQGDPVVCVHGNPTWSFYYRNVVKALRSTNFRVVVPDHIGCGLSDKPSDAGYAYTLDSRVADLTALLDELEIKDRVTLVVHDWGGMIGFAWAVRNPDKVARIVVLNTSAFRLPATKRLPSTLWLVRNVTPVANFLVRGFNAFSGLATSMAVVQKLDPLVAAGLTAPYDSWANRIATLRFVQDIPLKPGDPAWNTVVATEEGAGKLAGKPMLVCWGKQDFVFDDHFLAVWKEKFPAAEYHEFADAGHYVLEDKPAEVVGLVKDFLAKHPLPEVARA